MVRFPKSDLHTHTAFSDGIHTAREMVEEAVARGMTAIGLSDHSASAAGYHYEMTRENSVRAFFEINELKREFADRIAVLHGIERDCFDPDPADGYDYVIGSVHTVEQNGVLLPVDAGVERVRDAVTRYFGGDWFAFAKRYYETVAQLPARTKCGIIGHFDLITIFNEGGVLFDENDRRYRKYAMDALDQLIDAGMTFEINTGAVTRGYRKTPYPAPMLLHRIAERRAPVMLASDAHRKENLLGGFSDATLYAKACGVGSLRCFDLSGEQIHTIY